MVLVTDTIHCSRPVPARTHWLRFHPHAALPARRGVAYSFAPRDRAHEIELAARQSRPPRALAAAVRLGCERTGRPYPAREGALLLGSPRRLQKTCREPPPEPLGLRATSRRLARERSCGLEIEWRWDADWGVVQSFVFCFYFYFLISKNQSKLTDGANRTWRRLRIQKSGPILQSWKKWPIFSIELQKWTAFAIAPFFIHHVYGFTICFCYCMLEFSWTVLKCM
jgi:hypothetical protein